MTGTPFNDYERGPESLSPEQRYLQISLASEARVTDAFVSFGAPAVAELYPEDLAQRGLTAQPESMPAYLPSDVIQRPEGIQSDYGLAA